MSGSGRGPDFRSRLLADSRRRATQPGSDVEDGVTGRKPKVSRDEAESIAARYVGSRDANGCRLEVAEVKRVPSDPENWTIVVACFSPEGNEVDGPQILIVDGQTGNVETLEARFARNVF